MKLFFRKYGSGQPLIILHGLFGQSDNWNTLAKKYAEQGFEVYCVDQRNHGLSPHADEWTYDAMASDLKELIENENLSSPAIMGHSMGGKTAMFFVMLFPGVAKKIIVSDIAPRSYPPHHSEIIKALNSIDFNKISSRKEAEEQMNKFNMDFGTNQFLLKNLYWKDEENKKLDWRFNLKVIAEKYENAGVEVPFFTSEIPALFVRGDKSGYINADDEDEIQRRFANAQIVTIAGAGHWIHAEKPQEYFDATIKFLKS